MPAHQVPEELIRFVGKTGFITKELWEDYFSNTPGERAARKQWATLTARRYFEPHSERRVRNVLVANRSHRTVQDLTHGTIAVSPRAAYLAHDELLYRGILNSIQEGIISDWRSEPELKAMGRRGFRIENSDGAVKYPDALLYLTGDLRTKPTAVECELTQKSERRYSQIMSAYAGMKEISQVIFITNGPAVPGAIKRAMTANYYPSDQIPVFFVSADIWRKNASGYLKALFRHRSGAEQCPRDILNCESPV
jgi:hypothetical protein